MKKIITLSGDIGGGKSSVAASLVAVTGYEIIGTGKIQRAIAEKRGMTTLQLNKVSQTDRSVDDEIDSFVIDLGKQRDHLIIDSRLAWHFIPSAFKVFLTVDPLIGAERVFDASRSDEENESLESTLSNNRLRCDLEDVRFQKLYNVRFRDYANYDLVIDTSYTPPEMIAEVIVECYTRWLKRVDSPSLWINPKRLLPTQPVGANGALDYAAVHDSIKRSGFDAAQPITLGAVAGFLYILDGHKRVIAAEKLALGLAPALLLDGEEVMDGVTMEQRVNAISPADLRAWEEVLGYRMHAYPESI